MITTAIPVNPKSHPTRADLQPDFNELMVNAFVYENTLALAINTMADQMNALAAQINEQKAIVDEKTTLARAAAEFASESAIEVFEAANATPYSDEETYNFPQTVIVKSGEAFRCIGLLVKGDNPVGSITGDWFAIGKNRLETEVKVSNFTFDSVKMILVDCTNNDIKGTTPSAPSPGDLIAFTDYNNTIGEFIFEIKYNEVDPIMELSENMKFRNPLVPIIKLMYVDTLIGWRLV